MSVKGNSGPLGIAAKDNAGNERKLISPIKMDSVSPITRLRADKPSKARIPFTPVERAAAIALQRLGTIVIMEACKLSSRQQVATTACAVLPAPGIVG